MIVLYMFRYTLKVVFKRRSMPLIATTATSISCRELANFNTLNTQIGMKENRQQYFIMHISIH